MDTICLPPKVNTLSLADLLRSPRLFAAFNMTYNGNSFIGGILLPELSTDAVTSLKDARQDGFEYVVTELPIPSSLAPQSSNGNVGSGHRTSRTDVTRLESKWWSTSVVGIVSDPPHWKKGASANVAAGTELVNALTNTCHSSPVATRKVEASEMFMGMLEWASHMNIPAVILPQLPLVELNSNNVNGEDSDEDMFADDATPLNHRNEDATAIQTLNQLPSTSTTHLPKNTLVSSPHFQHHPFAQPPTSKCGSAFLSLLNICKPISYCLQDVITLPELDAYCTFHLLLESAEVPVIMRALHVFIGGGNIKAVSWDVSVFLKNKKGYPALSKSHQFMFQMLFGRLGRTLRVLVEGNALAPASTTPIAGGGATSRLHHLQYLRHLRSRPTLIDKLDSEEGILETPYLDHLQSPLQPLGDHLEYQTYETFEKDPVKYKQYGEAVALALQDGIEEGRYDYLGTTRTTMGQLKKMNRLAQGMDDLNFDDFDDADAIDGEFVEVDIHQVTILVVGAGRGPLVRESIASVARVSAAWMNESDESNNENETRKALCAKIIAIEKNPSAILYLQSLKSCEESWNGGQECNGSSDSREEGKVVIPGTSNVTVIGCDMREANSHPVLKI
eukprot:g11439.t1 g11439   contig5:860645-862866(+)